jgi:hypothetical protein
MCMLLYACFQDILIKQNIPMSASADKGSYEQKYRWDGQHAMLSNVILLSIFEKNKWSSLISAPVTK